MQNRERVFITGMGAITASGQSVSAILDAIVAGQQSIAPITQWDLSNFPVGCLGAEVKPYEPAKLLPDRKLMKVISKQDVLGIYAAAQAVEDSQMIAYRDSLPSTEEFNDRTAIFVGSPGNKYSQQYDFLSLTAKSNGDMGVFAEQLFSEVHPMWLLRILPNNVLAYTGITYGFKGVNHNITNHAVSGTQAIIEAYHAIQQGTADRAVIVGYDIGIEPQALMYYQKLGVISDNDLKPFDAKHDGTILAEGAAALILESESSVKQRNATCYAEVVSGATACESAGLFSIEANGEHLAALLLNTLENHDVTVDEIGVVVAHGNGNPKSDISEALAINAVFGENSVPVTAFKWAMGHTLCASGILDTILSAACFKAQNIPGIANWTSPAADCEKLNIAQDNRKFNQDKPYALIVNRGFGSMNACVLVKACE